MQDTTMLFGATVVMLVIYYLILIRPNQDKKKKAKTNKEDGKDYIEMQMIDHQFWQLVQDIRQENPRKYANVRMKFIMEKGKFRIQYLDTTYIIQVTSNLEPFPSNNEEENE